MKKDKILFIKKFVIFTIITLSLALLIESFLDHKLDTLDKLNKESATNSPQIIYFGDSVIATIAPADKDTRNIGEFLEEDSKKKVTTINFPSYHLGVFEAFSNKICYGANKPELVILPINLRSFSLEWDLRPEYQFDYEIQFINRYKEEKTLKYKIERIFEPLIYRITNLLGTKYHTEENRWENLPVYYDGLQRGIVKDYLLTKNPNSTEIIRSKYIFNYVYGLNESHRKIVSLKHIIENYKSCNIPLIIYLTPIDYVKGERYVGKDFDRILADNKKIFTKIGQEYNITIYDLTYDLNETYFNHPNTPNEHLTDKGREYVAEYISKKIEG